MKQSIVISLGGSVVVAEETPSSFFSELTSLIQRFKQMYTIYLVIGGGGPARRYIKRGRTLKLTEDQLDELGIMITRVNARLLSFILETGQDTIPESTQEALTYDLPIILMGGTNPGHSTDFVGAELAAQTKAYRYVIATNVDGVYDKDPRTYTDALFLPRIHINDLLTQYGPQWNTAGSNMVIDGPALQLIKDQNIQTCVINGNNLKELAHILEKKPFYGTEIQV